MPKRKKEHNLGKEISKRENAKTVENAEIAQLVEQNLAQKKKRNKTLARKSPKEKMQKQLRMRK